MGDVDANDVDVDTNEVDIDVDIDKVDVDVGDVDEVFLGVVAEKYKRQLLRYIMPP